MRKKIIKIVLPALLAAISILVIGKTEARAEDGPYSQMTMLDISKGPVIIEKDRIIGCDRNGEPVTAVNPEGYHIVSSVTQTSNRIIVESGVETKIVADNLNIWNKITDERYPSPLFIRPGSSVTLILEGKNKFTGADYNAAIGVPQDSDGTKAELTIEGDGSVECRTGKRGAGIGGGQKCGYTEGAGIIRINGGTIWSFGGDYGGGIGNSERIGPEDCRIIINGGKIYAQSANDSSGIGGGRNRNPAKADIVINGGVIYSTGPGAAVRGSHIEMNGGNLISCRNNSTDNWQSFNITPVDKNGNSVRIASIQLDRLDADRKLDVTCGDRDYTVYSDEKARVNVILFEGDGEDIILESESGNEYSVAYDQLPTPTTVADRPYRHPLLTITPDSDQTAQYGDVFVPTYKVYDENGTEVENTKSILSGQLGHDGQFPGSMVPFSVRITPENIRVIDKSHCITFTWEVLAQITKRILKVSAQDLEVYEGQYNRHNLPFVFQIVEGSLLPGDTMENAFSFSADEISGSDNYPPGEYADVGFSFNSSNYEVSLKDKGPTLKVLENECLLRQGDILTFGNDTEGNPAQWIVANVTDQYTALYSRYVYDRFSYDAAKEEKNQAIAYITEKIPSLPDYEFIQRLEILDDRLAGEILMDGGLAAAGTEDLEGNPAKYWMFTEKDYPYSEKAVYIDENGNLQEATDAAETAGLRLMAYIDVRSHTIPVIALSDQITSVVQYGDITAGTVIASVKDGANIEGHQRKSLSLLEESTDAGSFTLRDDGMIVAEKQLEPGSYTLIIQSEDTTGYKTERSVTFRVGQRQIDIIPQSGLSVYAGEAVLQIPYTYDESRLLPGDAMTGALGVEGDLSAAGQYPITLGTLSAGDNYHLVLSGDAMLTVLERTPSGQGEGGHGKSPEILSTDSRKADHQAALTGDAKMPFMLLLISILSAVSGVVIYRKSYRETK